MESPSNRRAVMAASIAVITLLTILLVNRFIGAAENRSLDNGFGTNGIVHTGQEGAAWTILVEPPDGTGKQKIVIAGDRFLARFLHDGSPDTAFHSKANRVGNGFIDTEVLGDAVSGGPALAIDDSARFIVAGFRTVQPLDNNFAVARYENNGFLDAFFHHDISLKGKPDGATSVIARQSKILVTGNAFNGNRDFVAIRIPANQLNQSLTDALKLDIDFNGGNPLVTQLGVIDDYPCAVGLDSDQVDANIIIAGTAKTADPQPKYKLAVVVHNAKGTQTIKKIFDDLEVPTQTLFQQILAPIGKGSFLIAASDEVRRYSFSPDLSADAFKEDLKVPVTDMKIHGVLWFENHIYVYGRTLGAPPSDFVLRRYSSNGAADMNFGTQGVIKTNVDDDDQPLAAAFQADRKLVVTGVTRKGGDYEHATRKIVLVRYPI